MPGHYAQSAINTSQSEQEKHRREHSALSSCCACMCIFLLSWHHLASLWGSPSPACMPPFCSFQRHLFFAFGSHTPLKRTANTCTHVQTIRTHPGLQGRRVCLPAINYTLHLRVRFSSVNHVTVRSPLVSGKFYEGIKHAPKREASGPRLPLLPLLVPGAAPSVFPHVAGLQPQP